MLTILIGYLNKRRSIVRNRPQREEGDCLNAELFLGLLEFGRRRLEVFPLVGGGDLHTDASSALGDYRIRKTDDVDAPLQQPGPFVPILDVHIRTADRRP